MTLRRLWRSSSSSSARPVGEDVLGGVKCPAWNLVEYDVVEADIEGLGDTGEDVERRGAALVLVADLAGVGADLVGQLP